MKTSILSLLNLISTLLFIIVGLLGLYVLKTSEIDLNSNTGFLLSNISNGFLLMGLFTTFDKFVSRREFLKENKKNIKEVSESIIPKKLKNIRDSGIVNSQMGLDINDFTKHLGMVQNCSIVINTIWIPDIDRISDLLVDSINNRGCNARILLLDPDAGKEAIRRRSRVTRYSSTSIKQKIRHNLEVLKEVQIEVHDKSKLKVKLHNSFISASILGVGETMWFGVYLNRRLATKGLHLKIQGASKPFFQDISQHFNSGWQQTPDFDLATFYSERDMEKIDEIKMIEDITEQDQTTAKT